MSDGQVVLYAEFTATPGSANEVEILIQDYADLVRTEPGNVAFDVYRRAEVPDRFFVFEAYHDRSAFEAHLGAEGGRAFNEELQAKIVEEQSVLSFLTKVERP